MEIIIINELGGRIANKTQPNCHIDLESTLWDKKIASQENEPN